MIITLEGMPPLDTLFEKIRHLRSEAPFFEVFSDPSKIEELEKNKINTVHAD